MKIEIIDVVTAAVALFALLAYLRIGVPVYLYAAVILVAAEVFVQVRDLRKKS